MSKTDKDQTLKNDNQPQDVIIEEQIEEFEVKPLQDENDEEENTSDPLEDAQNYIAELEAKLAQEKDRLLRIAADAENIRRRSEKEKSDALKYGSSNFAKDLLNVADNLRRALAALPEDYAKDDSLKGLITGLEMTESQLKDAFLKHHIEKVPSLGEIYSHEVHQAIAQMPSQDHQAGTIIEVMQEGYRLHDRLLRPAMVVVAKTPDDL